MITGKTPFACDTIRSSRIATKWTLRCNFSNLSSSFPTRVVYFNLFVSLIKLSSATKCVQIWIDLTFDISGGKKLVDFGYLITFIASIAIIRADFELVDVYHSQIQCFISLSCAPPEIHPLMCSHLSHASSYSVVVEVGNNWIFPTCGFGPHCGSQDHSD